MDVNITVSAWKQPFNPWELPDSYTLYEMAPAEIRSLLHPHWHNQKAPHPAWFYALAVWYFVIAMVGTFGNYCVLRVFGSTPSLRTPSNMLVMNLAVSDMLLLVTMLPECIFNFLNGGPWLFGETLCYAHAFCGALMGGTQIITLTMISWDRYNVIVNGISGTPLRFQKAVLMILSAWLISLAWAIAPLFGIGSFTLDSMLGSCSYDGLSTSLTNKYYMLLYTACMYFCPVFIVVGCYFFIVQAVFKHEDDMRQQAQKMNVSPLRKGPEQNAVSAEIRIAKVAVMNVTLWLISWTPYMVFCVMGTWGDQSFITPLPSMLQSLLAKTSCAYNPIIYCFTHPKFREIVKAMHPWICITVNTSSRRSGDTSSTGSVKTATSGCPELS